MSEQRKSEYVGADGKRRAFFVAGTMIAVKPLAIWESPGARHLFHLDDLGAVIEALTALKDELETEVVELGPYYRLVLRPGKDDALEFRWGTKDNPDWGPMAGTNLSISLCADLIKLGHRAGLAKGGEG